MTGKSSKPDRTSEAEGPQKKRLKMLVGGISQKRYMASTTTPLPAALKPSATYVLTEKDKEFIYLVKDKFPESFTLRVEEPTINDLTDARKVIVHYRTQGFHGAIEIFRKYCMPERTESLVPEK